MSLLLKALKQLRDVGPIEPLFGICGNVEELLQDNWPELQRFNHGAATAYTSWLCFTGNNTYPVPDIDNPTSQLAARQIYKDARLDRTMWDRRTAYGRLRHNLLDHLIDYFERKEA